MGYETAMKPGLNPGVDSDFHFLYAIWSSSICIEHVYLCRNKRFHICSQVFMNTEKMRDARTSLFQAVARQDLRSEAQW